MQINHAPVFIACGLVFPVYINEEGKVVTHPAIEASLSRSEEARLIYGLKFPPWYDELEYFREALIQAREAIKNAPHAMLCKTQCVDIECECDRQCDCYKAEALKANDEILDKLLETRS